jgi:hypothetical protein
MIAAITATMINSGTGTKRRNVKTALLAPFQ